MGNDYLGRCRSIKYSIGSGSGSVGSAVASETTGPWFESSHRQVFIQNISLLSTVKKLEKDAGNGPLLQMQVLKSEYSIAEAFKISLWDLTQCFFHLKRALNRRLC